MRIPTLWKTAASRFMEREKLYKKGGARVKPKDRLKSWNIFKGDQVQIISGRKDVGSQGPVIKVVRSMNSILIGGLNISRLHIPSGVKGQGLIIDREALVDIKNVSLVDPIDNKPTKIKWCQVEDEDNKIRSARISLRSGVEIPIPKFTPPQRYGRF